jgi:hypothetical protein
VVTRAEMASFANLHQALGKLDKEGNFDRTLDKVQEAIDLLSRARSELISGNTYSQYLA